jgi:predicted naringenin-chalcone synthase
MLARPASSRPASSEFREKAGFILTQETYRRCFFLVVELCALSFRRDDWSNSVMVATALFGDGAGPRC